MIVESPAKAKTIEKYLGKNFKVLSSYGHIRDLAKGNKGIDIKENFAPLYEVSKDKKEVIRNLKNAAQSVDIIWLATDDDREGEAISWHLKEVLKLDDRLAKRIVFREITKTAILKAIKIPRKIDYDLVNAQQARRILDRLVGFELSPILWKKIQWGLSAGRVQSIALRLITEREKEILAFTPEVFFKSNAKFSLQNDPETTFMAQLNKKFDTKNEGLTFVETCKESLFKIENIKKTPAKRSPSPPFITSSLQQEASKSLSFSVSQTMVLAQKLYEAGHITYMRTDSVNLSNDAVKMASQAIKTKFGEKYVQNRVFKNKNKNAQEAHEAIRPTNFEATKLSVDAQTQRLYNLIWQRTLASQMKDALLEKSIISIDISKRPEKFIAQGQVIVFDGFLKLYRSEDDNKSTEEKLLPPLKENQSLNLNHLLCREQYTSNKGRYNEASLVKKLEVLGIGRPSTYAPIISTIQKRNYAIKTNLEGNSRNYHYIVLEDDTITQKTGKEMTGVEKNKLLPTDTGKIVCKFLIDYFPNIMDYSFTAKAEEQFDQIALGKMVWTNMLESFYTNFHEQVIDISDNLDRSKVPVSRQLGIDPKTKLEVITRLGKYGPLVQLGENETASYASLLKHQSMDTVTLEEALKLLALPRDLGLYEDKKVVAAIGRFGPYIRHDGKFVSIKNAYEPLLITLEEAISLIEEKREADKKKRLKSFGKEKIEVLNGRFGPYFTHEGSNYKLPKEVSIPELTAENCFKIIEEKKNAKPSKRKYRATQTRKKK